MTFRVNSSPADPVVEQQALEQAEQYFQHAASVLVRYFGRTYSDLTRLLRSAFSEVSHASTKPNSTSR